MLYFQSISQHRFSIWPLIYHLKQLFTTNVTVPIAPTLLYWKGPCNFKLSFSYKDLFMFFGRFYEQLSLLLIVPSEKLKYQNLDDLQESSYSSYTWCIAKTKSATSCGVFSEPRKEIIIHWPTYHSPWHSSLRNACIMNWKWTFKITATGPCQVRGP